MKYLYLLMLLALGAQTSLVAQQAPADKFSLERTVFIKEVEDFMMQARRDEMKVLLEEFKTHMVSDKMIDSRYTKLHKCMNMMMALKFKAYPHFTALLDCVNSLLVDETKAAKDFGPWIEILEAMLIDAKVGKYKQYEEFMVFSRSFIKYNALFYIENGHSWRPSSTDYKWNYNNGKVTLTYPQTDIVGYRKEDTVIISKTSGVYEPLERQWIGNGAEVKWDIPGLENVKCTFGAYKIEAQKTEFTVSNATFYHPTMFEMPIMGTFTDKITPTKVADDAYPRFESDEKQLPIKNIGEGLDFYGGFKMQGAKVVTYGDEFRPAILRVYDKNKRLAIKAQANNFSVRPGERIVSEEAEVSLYFDQDSIYHPGIEFRYNIGLRTVKLTKNAEGRGKTPFINSYHMVEMFVRTIEWNIDDKELELGKGDAGKISTKEVLLESFTLFDKRRYFKYQNISNFNPLARIVAYWQAIEKWRGILKTLVPLVAQAKSAELDIDYTKDLVSYKDIKDWIPQNHTMLKVEELKVLNMTEAFLKENTTSIDTLWEEVKNGSQYLRKLRAIRIARLLDTQRTSSNVHTFDIGTIGRLLNDMVGDGFIFYNPETQMVVLRDKLIHYNASSIGQTDYDNIRVKSVPPTTSKIEDPEDAWGEDAMKKGDTTVMVSNRVNAVLNMESKDIYVNWVNRLMLSDSQQVFVFPENRKVKMSKNRNMNFNGEVYAGRAIMSGKKFFFGYSDFYLELDSIKTMELWMPQRKIDPQSAFFSPNPEVEKEDEGSFGEGNLYANLDPDAETDEYHAVAVEDASEKGFETKELQPITSLIENFTAHLQIDLPNNKSGKSMQQNNKTRYFDKSGNEIRRDNQFKDDGIAYPSLETRGKAYVYYDKFFDGNIFNYNSNNPKFLVQKGAYKRDKFFYEMEEFNLDGLDKFDPKTLNFKGKLVSSEIFPDIKEDLKMIWPYACLGFEHKTPRQGYPIFKGKGRFTGLVGLNNFGLLGSGQVEYLGSKLKSNDIIFFPDKMTGSSDNFNLDEKRGGYPEYPKVQADAVNLEWKPYSDSMYIASKEGIPFKFFSQGDYYLNGKIILTPGGVNGAGEFDWADATMKSNLMRFGAFSIDTDTAALKIKAINDQTSFAFDTKNVKASVNFDNNISKFKTNDIEHASTELPYNKLKTSMDEFTWNMQEQTIFLKSSQGTKDFFVAPKSGYDSLKFGGTRADFDLKTNSLSIDGVEFIPVADAKIFPKGGHVDIGAGDEGMKDLVDAQIIADTANKYHVINRCNVKIEGKYAYKADGWYEYPVGDKKQEIRFNNIGVSKQGKKDYVTKASGELIEDDQFIVDKKTQFKGEVKLSADNFNLFFEGDARLNTSKIPRTPWFNIKCPIDRKNVEIDLKTPRNPQGEKLYTGIFLNRDSMSLYPIVLQPKKRLNDRALFITDGLLKYHEKTDEFSFRDSTCQKTDDKRGQKMVVSDVTGKIQASGQFQFGSNLPGVTFNTAGEITTYFDNSDYIFKMIGGLKFPMPQPILDIIAADLVKDESVLEYPSNKHAFLQKAVNNLFQDDKKADKTNKRLTDAEKLEIPSDLGYTAFFSRIDLKWSEKWQSFFNTGPIEMVTFGGKQIDRAVPAGFEIYLSPKGDAFSFYFETPGTEDKYFFTYQDGLMKVFSTNDNFMTAITSLKKKDKEFKLADGTNYIIEAGSSGELSAFIRRTKDK